MLSILSILNFIHDNLTETRFQKLDEDHMIDEKTGIELHMYDDWFKMTKGGDTLATLGDFAPKEQEVIWAIKQAVADPVKAKAKEDNYHVNMTDRRCKLAMMFEQPEPVVNKQPIMETGTAEYTG